MRVPLRVATIENYLENPHAYEDLCAKSGYKAIEVINATGYAGYSVTDMH